MLVSFFLHGSSSDSLECTSQIAFKSSLPRLSIPGIFHVILTQCELPDIHHPRCSLNTFHLTGAFPKMSHPQQTVNVV